MRHAVGALVDGRYQVRALLAEGGLAEASRAEVTTTGRDVVLKVPHIAIAGDPAAFNRYRRMTDIAARRGADPQ